MKPRDLLQKPLVEAILEVRWALEPGPDPETKRDPHYKFLLGTLRKSVEQDYPHHEELPAAAAPDQLTPHLVHHRFRVSPGGWPLLQVGPGVFTVNETENYRWTDFEKRVNDGIRQLVASHPKPDALTFEVTMLRYINALTVDPAKVNVLEFLATKMKTYLALPESIFTDNQIGRIPVSMGCQLVFPCNSPNGVLQFRFGTGQRAKQPALIFELWFTSREGHVPKIPEQFREWVRGAHGVLETAFFKLIEGDLEREFSTSV